jgi:hypothetical protein
MRGFDEEEMTEVAAIVAAALAEDADLETLSARSAGLCERHPLYPGFGGYCRYRPYNSNQNDDPPTGCDR